MSPIPSALSCPATALPLAQPSSVPPTPTMLASSCPTGVLLSASVLCLSPSPFYSPDPREASSHIRDLSPPPLPFHRPQLGPMRKQARGRVGTRQAGPCAPAVLQETLAEEMLGEDGLRRSAGSFCWAAVGPFLAWGSLSGVPLCGGSCPYSSAIHT